ncbi:MAG: NYN domain-containing protein [Eubacteriales bacterium]
MEKTVVGILAHVDAGKTTLAEALLYQSGRTRRLGRVDHGDTLLDTHALERERGITIFASQAVFTAGEREITLLDTPGHVDFSAETERTMQVLDYAILVISGTDGVQAHTRTLWRLLSLYHVPVFVFVTKMDFARRTCAELMAELQEEFGEGFVDFSNDGLPQQMEQLALMREDLLEKYLDGNTLSDADIISLIRSRRVIPCCFGSGLKLRGIEAFLDVLARYAAAPPRLEAFGAKVFKIGSDPQGNRLTHMKITGGTLRVRDMLACGSIQEKIGQIRIYSGERFTAVEEAAAGSICTVPGLTATHAGQGLGAEASSGEPVLEPVMRFRLVLPQGCDAQTMLPRLRRLEEEDPQLHVTWNSRLQEIHVELMGEIQAEILRSLIEERYGVPVTIDSGRILYKETIRNTVEGVGHYEPLRHYAEVHLLLEPLARGSGLVFASTCSENSLDRSWQRLILTHLAEKQHLGVLTGAPVTDMKITLTAGRAHIKHTEGGDFRQATYRAVRQGLMQAQSVLLEPYCTFRLEVPAEQIGRAVSDLRMRRGSIGAPESSGSMMLLRGRGPASTLNGYAMEVAAYTGGTGRFITEPDGYDECCDAEKVITAAAYNPESDLENTPDSVFCAHGAGFPVKWNRVPEYMHLESTLAKPKNGFVPGVRYRNLRLDDKELEAIMEREFGPIRRPSYRPPAITAKMEEEPSSPAPPPHVCVIVDGYNVIHAWDGLRSAAEAELENARRQLMDVLCNYAAYTKYDVILVFDAYNVAGNHGSRFTYHTIRVVYTEERETADMYIEKLIARIGKNDRVRVVTSDALIQLSAVRVGVLRVSAAEFEREVDAVQRNIDALLHDLTLQRTANVGEALAYKKNDSDAADARRQSE